MVNGYHSSSLLHCDSGASFPLALVFTAPTEDCAKPSLIVSWIWIFFVTQVEDESHAAIGFCFDTLNVEALFGSFPGLAG